MLNSTTTLNPVKIFFDAKQIPSEIKALSRWILWNEKKLPFTPKKTPASSIDPNTWNTFDTCKHALDSQFLFKPFKGLGFVFDKSDGYVGIDIDDAFPLSEPVQDLITMFSSYTEISQSGKGLHILIKGVKPRSECNFQYRGVRIEVYEEKRYFALTGNLFRADNTIYERQNELDELFDQVFGAVTIPEPRPFLHQERIQPFTDDNRFVNAVIQTLQEYGRGMFDDYQNDATRQDFLRLGFALKAKDLPFEVFDSIVCGSQNYDPEENRKLYEGLKPKYVKFGTAYEYAKRANQERLTELLSQRTSRRQEECQVKQTTEQSVNLTLSPGQHLSDLPLADILRKSNDAAIYAGTGTGKTFFALNELSKIFPDSNVIIFEPTRLLTEQKASDTQNAVNIIVAGKQANGERLQISTYNGIDKLSEEFLKNSICVIDEAHQLTICEGYRGATIRRLKESLPKFQKRIYMTGTPMTFGANYDPDVVVNVHADSEAIPVNAIEVSDKWKAIEALHIPGTTTLVYCFRKDTCDLFTNYARKQGFLAARIHSETDTTIPHKNLIDGKMIDKALDFLFVTSYPTEGVDILDHNIRQIVIADYCSTWMIKQLVSRTRNTRIENVSILYTQKENPPEVAAFTPERERQSRASYSHLARENANFLNAQLLAGRFDIGSQKVRTALLGQMAKTVKRVETPLAGCSESFSFEPDDDFINWLVYQDYERACRGNQSFYFEELTRYGFIVNPSQNAITATKTAEEKETYTETLSELREEKQERFEKDLQEASQLEDDELFEQWEEETDAKERLRILAKETGNKTLALKILQAVGNSKQKFNTALKQVIVANYRKGKVKSMPLEKLLRLAKVGEFFTIEEIFERVKEIYATDPQLKHLVSTLSRTPNKFTSRQAVLAFEMFYDLVRTTERTNGEKKNVYRIASCNPLAKFEGVTLRSELVLTHISEHILSKNYARCESETAVKTPRFDLGKQAFYVDVSQEYSEYAEQQIATFGKVF